MAPEVIRYAIDISIHSPREGRDWRRMDLCPGWLRFQSTRPVRGETRLNVMYMAGNKYFNPLAP